MIDIKLIRTNPELVKENIKKKFQDEKIELVDKVAELDKQYRETKVECDSLRNQRKVNSKEIGGFMAKGLKDEAEKVKAEVSQLGTKLEEMEALALIISAIIEKRNELGYSQRELYSRKRIRRCLYQRDGRKLLYSF